MSWGGGERKKETLTVLDSGMILSKLLIDGGMILTRLVLDSSIILSHLKWDSGMISSQLVLAFYPSWCETVACFYPDWSETVAWLWGLMWPWLQQRAPQVEEGVPCDLFVFYVPHHSLKEYIRTSLLPAWSIIWKLWNHNDFFFSVVQLLMSCAWIISPDNFAEGQNQVRWMLLEWEIIWICRKCWIFWADYSSCWSNSVKERGLVKARGFCWRSWGSVYCLKLLLPQTLKSMQVGQAERFTEPWPNRCTEFLQYVAVSELIFHVLPITPTFLISMERYASENFSAATCLWICFVENELSHADCTFIFTQKGRVHIRKITLSKDIMWIMSTSFRRRHYWCRYECWIFWLRSFPVDWNGLCCTVFKSWMLGY